MNQNVLNKKRLYQAFIILFCVVTVVAFDYSNNSSSNNVVIDFKPESKNTTGSNDFFTNLSLEAKSVYVYDILDGSVLYQKNAETQLPLASVTKVMTVLTASNIVPNHELVLITSDNLKTQGDSGLSVGEEWNLNKLINFAMVVSSNDAMSAIASVAGSELVKEQGRSPEQLFVNQMNTLAKSIGLVQTYFVNESGLDVTNMTSGGYGSARDMAKLFEYIIKNKPVLLEATQYPTLAISSKQKIHSASNTNKIINSIPGIIASKTGLTDLSGGNLVIAFDAGIMHPVVISVLGSSEDGRFIDTQKLVDATVNALNAR